jgi:hypothetical protein
VRARLPAGRGRVQAPDREIGATRAGGMRVSSHQSPRESSAGQDRIARELPWESGAARGVGMAVHRLGEE